jgi:hypothetical protein
VRYRGAARARWSAEYAWGARIVYEKTCDPIREVLESCLTAKQQQDKLYRNFCAGTTPLRLHPALFWLEIHLMQSCVSLP